MCFELGSRFGKGRREDFGGERSAPTTARAGRRKADRRNGYYWGTDHKAPAPAPTPAYHHPPHGATAVDEPGHKAYHDGAQKGHHAGGHGGYAAYVQDKLADSDTTKLPAAWHNKVGDDAGHTYTVTPRLDQAAADHRENAAVDYHQYPTTTSNTTMVTY